MLKKKKFDLRQNINEDRVIAVDRITCHRGQSWLRRFLPRTITGIPCYRANSSTKNHATITAKILTDPINLYYDDGSSKKIYVNYTYSSSSLKKMRTVSPCSVQKEEIFATVKELLNEEMALVEFILSSGQEVLREMPRERLKEVSLDFKGAEFYYAVKKFAGQQTTQLIPYEKSSSQEVEDVLSFLEEECSK